MIDKIYNKSLDNEITKEDALDLVTKTNSFQLFDTADKLRQDIIGDKVTYVSNKAIDITDRCIIDCNFCSFKNSENYEMTIEEILESIKEAKELGVTEICLFGGIAKHMTIDYYSDLIKSIKKEYDICLHALSPAEVYKSAEFTEMSIKDALKQLKKAGMDTMTGASAEILDDNIRQKICPNKLKSQEWIDVVKEAHNQNIPTTSTIMYGTVEGWKERINHLFILKEIQEETHGFTELVPLSFLSENNRIGKSCFGATGIDDLKLHAISRIILSDIIPNIQVSWIKLGVKMTQVILNCGANDIGGTMIEDKISVAAGANMDYLHYNEINSLITSIDRVPQERTTQYKYIKK
ncbi:MAG: 5-amino-6-(D-ribitylamino)uracil--L-tyrosine 4-hydroxyphenyl transferase CofH [Methanobacteriaceae archaeon]|nr:5-amino-6-(D-ribitylamino)uracil--L-tyrosine 4-hydroxyphenyl transferase CofH [Methanobacteriaceae archaeon]